MWRELTVKKWSEMTTRERDALVAEKVMGWEWSDVLQGARTLDGDGKFLGVKPFSPSTDISAAWEVVEKVRERFYFHIHVAPSNGGSNGWWAEFNLNDSNNLANSPTAPEAICLAALKAVGCDVE